MCDIAAIERGIAAYAHERAVLLRLLRKRGSFTEREFDHWYIGREFKRQKLRIIPMTGDTFLLGIGANGFSEWAKMIELLQYMMRLGEVDAQRENGLVVYRPKEKA